MWDFRMDACSCYTPCQAAPVRSHIRQATLNDVGTPELTNTWKTPHHKCTQLFCIEYIQRLKWKSYTLQQSFLHDSIPMYYWLKCSNLRSILFSLQTHSMAKSSHNHSTTILCQMRPIHENFVLCWIYFRWLHQTHTIAFAIIFAAKWTKLHPSCTFSLLC